MRRGATRRTMLLELIGPPRIVDPRKSPEVADFWNYGDPFETYPIDTARLRRVVELVADKAEWGKQIAAAARSGHRRASQLPELRRNRRRGRGGRQGAAVGAAGRHCDRLRLRRQSRAHLLADRRRGGDGAEPRALRRDQLQERARRAEQLRRLPGAAHRQVAADHACAGSCPTGSTCRRAASASRGCRPSRRRCATPSSPRPASASGACRSATSSRRSLRNGIPRRERSSFAAGYQQACGPLAAETVWRFGGSGGSRIADACASAG